MVRDIQAMEHGFPKIPISKVGVRKMELPLHLYRKNSDEILSVIADVSSYCNLTEGLRGINMSRILRSLTDIFENTKDTRENVLTKAAYALQEAHNTDDIYIKASFKYPYWEKSPITNLSSPEVVNVELETYLLGNQLKRFLTVKLVGMSLCPCSKEMSLLRNNISKEQLELINDIEDEDLRIKILESGFGAHNQKSYVRFTVEEKDNIDIEDLVDIINTSVSCQTYSVLKRPDEKYVTEVSYMGGYYDENREFNLIEGAGPKFVEDIARFIADKANSILDKAINDFVIVVQNEESIHSQGIEACAVLSAGRSLK